MHRVATVILEVADLAASTRLYRDVFGLDLHAGDDNDLPGDRWLSGAHAAVSWHEGAFLHFSLYQAEAPDQTTRLAQIGLMCADVIHPPREEPWGITARYEDLDGNVISLTESDR